MKQPKNRYYRTAWAGLGLLVLWFQTGPLQAGGEEDASKALTLWYAQPAAKWTEALPIGNGRLGAMVYGGIEKEQLQINEDTLWSGGPHDYSNPEAYPHLATVRGLLDKGQYNEAEAEAEKMMGVPIGQMAYQPLGDLFLKFPQGGEASNYRRELDLRNAVCTVSYVVADTRQGRSPMKPMVSLMAAGLCLLGSAVHAAEIQPTWESMAEHYKVPQWFVDGKIGVWTHWGVPSATDENRPNDGSHYGRRMYGPNEGESGAQLKMTKELAAFHAKRYGPPSEFGYEDLVPLFKAEKWDPEALVTFFKENGARFIMPVACHHDNFDMYDSFHPWNSVDMGPKRDTLKEWKAAASKHGLKFGVSTHLYWSPRFFKTARQYQKPGTLEAKLFNMEFDPKGYASQDSWNEHWYARCWEIIEKYDPDMFNNDAPFPDEKRGQGTGDQAVLLLHQPRPEGKQRQANRRVLLQERKSGPEGLHLQSGARQLRRTFSPNRGCGRPTFPAAGSTARAPSTG